MRKDLGLLLVRGAIGGTLAAHGAQKLFGWFGGGGIEGTATGFHHGGFRPGRQHALAAGASEAGGGALLALGLATPAAGAAVVGTMAVAAELHRPAGFFAQKGGYEYPLILGAAGAALALAGPGKLSLDQLLGNRLNRPWMGVVALAASVAASQMIVRRRKEQLAADARAKAAAEAQADAEARTTTVAGDGTSAVTSRADVRTAANNPT